MRCQCKDTANWIHANGARIWMVSRNYIEIILSYSTLKNDSAVLKGFIDNYCVGKGFTHACLLRLHETTKTECSLVIYALHSYVVMGVFFTRITPACRLCLYNITANITYVCFIISRADSMFVPSQWGTLLLCDNVSHWLGASLQSALSRDINFKHHIGPDTNIWSHTVICMILRHSQLLLRTEPRMPYALVIHE